MDIDEFTRRVEPIKERLYRTAFGYIGSESMALDAVDEALYKGLQGLKSLRREEYFETWLTRILINECKRELKRRKREQPLDTLSETAVQAFETLPVKDAILRLPHRLREIIVLRFFADLTIAETAKNLDIPLSTAASRQKRALQLLKIELAEEESI